eukprot:CAMPEP_0117661992 /NCGR_PEP_ID=MMETSP0804-20121206/7825_1 /TAXON_ID=1074897 /ORGANISM="Tetraselmis astigmatica, Strain CCMP880" /LENGTH=1749 /DNA_ID=CAMNT_0005468881 /DNA_START=438 /DNA_END=5685 /DNA_ORIENTATION=+
MAASPQLLSGPPNSSGGAQVHAGPGSADRDTVPELFDALARHMNNGGGSVLRELFQAVDPKNGAGKITLHQCQDILQELFAGRASTGQLEYLAAVLDADQDSAVDLQDVSVGVKEWAAFSAHGNAGRAASDAGEALAAVKEKLHAYQGAGLRLLKTEVLSALQLLPLAERGCASAQEGAAAMPELEDRAMMTGLAVLDEEGQAATSVAKLLEAVHVSPVDLGLGSFCLAAPSNFSSSSSHVSPYPSSPMFMRAARSAYHNFMQGTSGDSDSDSPSDAFGHSTAQERADALLKLATDDASSSSSFQSGTPYFEVSGTPGRQGHRPLDFNANPLWGEPRSSVSTPGTRSRDMSPRTTHSGSQPPLIPSGRRSGVQTPVHVKDSQQGAKDPRAVQATLEQQVIELKAEILTMKAVQSAKREIAAAGNAPPQPPCAVATAAAGENQEMLEKELAQAIQRCAELEGRIATANEIPGESSEDLRQEMEEMEMEAAELRDDNARLSCKVEELEAACSKLRLSADEAKEELAFAKSRMEDVISEAKEESLAGIASARSAWKEEEVERTRELATAVDLSCRREAGLQAALDAAEEALRASEAEKCELERRLAACQPPAATPNGAMAEEGETAARALQAEVMVTVALSEAKAELQRAMGTPCTGPVAGDVMRQLPPKNGAVAAENIGGPSELHEGGAEEMTRLESELSRLEADAAAWEEDRAQLMEQILELSGARSRLEADLAAAVGRAAKQEEEGAAALGRHEEEASQWQAERLRLAEQLEAAAGREAERSEALRSAERLAAEKAEVLQVATHQGLRHSEEMAHLREQVAALAVEKAAAAAEAAGLRHQLAGLSAERADLAAEAEGLQEQVEALAAAEHGLRQQIRALQDQRADLRSENEGLREEAVALAAEKEDLASENHSLQEQVNDFVASQEHSSRAVPEKEGTEGRRKVEGGEEDSRRQEDLTEMMQQLMLLGQQKSLLEAEHKQLQRHTEELEVLLEEMQAAEGAGGVNGGGQVLLLEELQQQHMEEMAAWEAERSRLKAALAAATAESPALRKRPKDTAFSGSERLLEEDIHEDMDSLRTRCAELEEELRQAKEVAAAAASSGPAGASDGELGLSPLLMEELHQQHMDEMAEWEAERKRLEGIIAEKEGLLVVASAGKGPRLPGPRTEAGQRLARADAGLQDSKGPEADLQTRLAAASFEKDGLLTELRALRAATSSLASAPEGDRALTDALASAADVLVSDAMAAAREFSLEARLAALQERNAALELELQAALTEQAELLRNPLWETEVPEEEWRAELAEKEAMVESLLDEHAAMEGEIVAFMGEKAVMEASLEKAGAEKKALQSQLNMVMITMSDSDNQLHEAVQERERLEEEVAGLQEAVQRLEGGHDTRPACTSAVPASKTPGPSSGFHDAHIEARQLQGEVELLVQRLEQEMEGRRRAESDLKALQADYEDLWQKAEAAEAAVSQAARQAEGELNTLKAQHEELLRKEEVEMPAGGSHAPSEAPSNVVSMLVLEEFQEEQLAERAAWDEERARLQRELAELRAAPPPPSRPGDAQLPENGSSEGGEKSAVTALAEKEKLVAEVRALRAARVALASPPEGDRALTDALASAADVLVSDAMAAAREFSLEARLAALQERNAALELELQAALTEQAELLRNPLWETEVPEEEWRAELAEKEAMVESLLDEHAAMEGEIVAFMGEKAVMEASLEKAGAEKKALQSQLNMVMITMSDSDNQLHEAVQERERL